MENLRRWRLRLEDTFLIWLGIPLLFIYPIWMCSLMSGGYFNPNVWVLIISGVILIYPIQFGFWSIEFARHLLRQEAMKSSTWSTSALRLTAAGAQMGALILPKILFPRQVFVADARMPFIVWGWLPSPQFCGLLISLGVGALLGGVSLGSLVSYLETVIPPPPTYNTQRPPESPVALLGNLGFSYLQWIPQIYLLTFIPFHAEPDIEQRLNSILAIIGMVLFYFGLRSMAGEQIHSAFSKSPLTPNTGLATMLAWICGAPLGWWLCGGHANLQALIHHRMPVTLWTERELYFTWSVEGLVGASLLACAVEVWMLSRSGQLRKQAGDLK